MKAVTWHGRRDVRVAPMPMMELFDKQIQLRMGQANVRHWLDDIMPVLTGDGGAQKILLQPTA